jgi:hypothetical protein
MAGVPCGLRRLLHRRHVLCRERPRCWWYPGHVRLSFFADNVRVAHCVALAPSPTRQTEFSMACSASRASSLVRPVPIATRTAISHNNKKKLTSSGSINNLLGPRLTLFLGCLGYILYVGSLWAYQTHGTDWFVILAGAILGVTGEWGSPFGGSTQS